MNTAVASNEVHRPTEPSATSPTKPQRLPAVLRSFGAAAVLFSLYSFLMRGWDGSSDLLRYLMLLGHTGALCGIGLGIGTVLKEGKSARLLMMLSLASVAANFAILGAFMFAASVSTEGYNYPHFLAWSVGGLDSALLTLVGALAILVPVTLLGFRSLARGMSQKMTGLFLLGNACLLIPVRDPIVVSLLVGALAAVIVTVNARTARERTETKTFEGAIALLLQFAPLAIMIGRSLWLYHSDALVFAAAGAMLFVGLRQFSLLLEPGSNWRTLFEVLSVPCALFTGITGAAALDGILPWTAVAITLGTLLGAAMCYEVSLRAGNNAGTYRLLASVMVVAGMLLNLSIEGGVLAGALCFTTGIGLMAFSYIMQLRIPLFAGGLLVIAALFDQGLHLLRVFDLDYWAGFAVCGVLTIVAASVIERHGSALRQRATQWRQAYGEWQY